MQNHRCPMGHDDAAFRTQNRFLTDDHLRTVELSTRSRMRASGLECAFIYNRQGLVFHCVTACQGRQYCKFKKRHRRNDITGLGHQQCRVEYRARGGKGKGAEQ